MENYNKWFFRIAGFVTALGALPSMIAPHKGTLLAFGIDISSLPAVSPLLGHWGIMVVGIGVLLFLSASNKNLRLPIVWYSNLEKSYLVLVGIFTYINNPDIGQYYLLPIVVDSLLVIGGIVYLVNRKK